MIFPHLSSTPPEIGKSFRRPAAYRVHGPFYPSVVLTEPPFGRKSHYAVMDLRLNPGAVRLLQASCRSGLSTVLAFTADVAPHHRFVPDECVFGCQGAFAFAFAVTTRLLRFKFYRESILFRRDSKYRFVTLLVPIGESQKRSASNRCRQQRISEFCVDIS